MAFKKKTEGEGVPVKRVRSVTVQNRIAHPFGAPSLDIPLKSRDLVVRVVDAQLRAGRVHEMVQKGWTFVTPADLAGAPEDFGFTVEADRIVRGERGREVLMKMARDDYDAIQGAKAADNARRLGGKRGKSALLDEVAAKVGDRGDEAADFLNARLTITDTRETVPIEPD